MTVAVPMFIIWGETATRHKTWGKFMVVACSMYFGIYLLGYLMGKQIM